MKKHEVKKGNSHLLWPIAVLLFLTIGVFLTTRETPQRQDLRSRAQFFQDPSLFPSGTFDNPSESPTDTPTVIPSDTPTETPPPTLTPTPAGAVIHITFNIPSISTLSGNLDPKHPKRDVVIAFYNKDDNTSDQSIIPQYTMHVFAEFDNDPSSSTYGQFIKRNIYLSDYVKNGKYQIGLKTDQSLLKLIKNKETNVRGSQIDIESYAQLDLNFQSLLLGDISAGELGDNRINIHDYNALMDCYGIKFNSATCEAKQRADLDDNGEVDGIDYNILLLGFNTVLSQGLPIFVSPTISPAKHSTPTPTKKPEEPKKSSNVLGGVLIFIFIILALLVAGGLFFLKKSGKLKMPKTGNKDNSEKEYFIKKKSEDPDKKGTWLTLADDNGQILGHYTQTYLKDGFAKIKGKMKTENGKTFMEISEIIWEK